MFGEALVVEVSDAARLYRAASPAPKGSAATDTSLAFGIPRSALFALRVRKRPFWTATKQQFSVLLKEVVAVIEYPLNV